MEIKLPDDPQFNKYYSKHCKYLNLQACNGTPIR